MRVSVLGPVSIDGEVNGLSPRDRAVLSALTVRLGEPVHTDVLAQVLWGDDAPPSGAKVIQGCVVRLRRRLGPAAIETTTHGYRLVLRSDETDTRRFQRLVGRAKELFELEDFDRAGHAAGQALELWRGRPFVDTPDWDPARVEGQRLEEMRLEAQELQVASDLARGRYAEAVAAARANLAEGRLRERRWELLARAQYAAGRQVEALRTLQQARSFLADEAGVDPGPDLVALEEAILAQDPALAGSGPEPRSSTVCPYVGMVPFGSDDADVFYGRDREVHECLRHLEGEGVVVVAGPSGSGKSSLVRAGIVSSLEAEGRSVVVITPGGSPMRSLTAVPVQGPPSVLVVDQCEELVTLCTDDEQRAAFLDAVVAHAERAPLVVTVRADVLGDLSLHRPFARLVERGLFLLGPMDEEALRAAIVEPAVQAGLLLEPGLVELLVHEVEGEPSALPLLSHCLRQTWELREGRTMTVTGYAASGGIRGAVAQTAEGVFTALDPAGRDILRNLLLRMTSVGSSGDVSLAPLGRRSLPADARARTVVESLIAERLLTSDGEVVEVAHEALVRAWPRLLGWLDDDLEGARIVRHLSVAADTWDGMGRPDSELYRGARLAAALDWHDRTGSDITPVEQEFLRQSKRLSDDEAIEKEARARRQQRVNRQLKGLLAGAVALLAVSVTTGLLFLREADRASAAATTAEARRISAQAQLAPDPDLALLMAVEAVEMAESADTRASLLEVINRNDELVATARTTPAVASIATTGDVVVVGDFHTSMAVHDAATLEPVDLDAALVAGRGVSDLVVRPGTGDLLAVTSFSSVTGIPEFDGSAPLTMLDGETMQETSLRLGDLPTDAWGFAPVFSDDGRYVAVGFVGYRADAPVAERWSVIVWDLTAPERALLTLETDWGQAFSLSADGSRLHLFTGDSLAVHDTVTGSVVDRLEGVDGVNGLAAGPDGGVIAAVKAQEIVLLQEDTLEQRSVLSGFDAEVQHVAFSNDGMLIAAGDGEAIRIWDVATGQPRHEFRGADRLVRLAFGPDDSVLYSVGFDGMLLAHDLAGGRFTPRLANVDWSAPFLAPVSPDGSRVAMASHPEQEGGNHGLQMLDLETGATVGPIDPGHGFWGDLSWSPDSRRLATSGADGVVRLWDAETLEKVGERAVGEGHIAAVDFTADGSLILVAERVGTVRFLDAGDLGEVARSDFDVADGIIWGFAAPDNRTAVVIAGPPDFLIVDVVDGTVLHQPSIEAGAWSGDFSPDGRHLMVGGGTGGIGFFDLDAGEWLAPPASGHKDSAFVRYSADGSRAVSGSFDGQVVLWDAVTGSRLGQVSPGSHLTTPSFHPDGHTVLIPYEDGSVYTWDTRTEAWTTHACQVAGRQMTEDEWRAVVGSDPIRETCATPG